MIVTEVVWLEQFAEKIEQKHRVSRNEVEQVFLIAPDSSSRNEGTFQAKTFIGPSEELTVGVI